MTQDVKNIYMESSALARIAMGGGRGVNSSKIWEDRGGRGNQKV